MFKASELVAFASSMIGMPYWYGTCVYRCTKDLRQRKAIQYPSHYGASRTSMYNQHIAAKSICMDCVGLIKGFFWTNGGEGVVDAIGTNNTFSSKYGSNGCPDKGANGLLDWCKSKKCTWGSISTLPDVPGILLFSSGHVGVYVGDGYAVEARGFAYGVVKTKITSRSWKTWSYLPATLLQYDGSQSIDIPETPVAEYKLGERTLENVSPYMTGADVTELQTRLNALGFECGKIDSKFGASTEKGVRAFQTSVDIDVDGKFGSESFKALETFNAQSDPLTFTEYTVQRGDTLWKIAKKLLGKGGRYVEIKTLNDMTSDMIRTGKILKIPNK